MHKILPRLYASCKKGLAFNLLNDDYGWSAKESYTLQAFKPGDVLSQLKLLSKYTSARTDYLGVDASFFAWREEKFKVQEV